MNAWLKNSRRNEASEQNSQQANASEAFDIFSAIYFSFWSSAFKFASSKSMIFSATCIIEKDVTEILEM